MGSCASMHKGQETHMKRRLVIGSKHNKLVNPSPVKLEIATVEDGVDHPPKSLPSPPPPAEAPSVDFGSSKEETFFDSQIYLESDCEDDDFYSVKGDFTPSRGNTPIHHRFSASSPKINGPLFTERITPISATLISPTDKKKRLSELFKESLGGDQEFGDLDAGTTPYSSACSTATPSQELKRVSSSVSGKPAGQCCLPVPRLLSRHSFSGGRKNAPPENAAVLNS